MSGDGKPVLGGHPVTDVGIAFVVEGNIIAMGSTSATVHGHWLPVRAVPGGSDDPLGILAISVEDISLVTTIQNDGRSPYRSPITVGIAGRNLCNHPSRTVIVCIPRFIIIIV